MNILTTATRDDYITLLDAIALNHPDRDAIAIVYLETDHVPLFVTRGEFQESILQYAAALQRMGVEPGDLVIIAHTQNLEGIYCFWAAMAIGAIPSIFSPLTDKLDPDIYMQNMATLVEFSDVRMILTNDEFASALDAQVACEVYGSSVLFAAITQSDEALVRHAKPDHTAFLQHSSGTTGLQKGVALSHEAVLNHIASYSDSLELNETDVVASWLPLYHDMGLIAGFLMPLVQGIPLVLMSPFDWVSHPSMLLRAIDDYKATLCWLPNFAYNHMARRIRDKDIEGVSLETIRSFINSSEPVFAESHDLFLDRFGDYGATPEMLTVSYAMAENTFAVTQTPLGLPARTDTVNRKLLEAELIAETVSSDHPNAIIKVSCGPPIGGVQVKVVDADGRELTERHVGEVLIRSDFMLTEYYGRDDLNPFQDGWCITGDRGYIADGEVYLVGRSKDLIINAGKNVFPQDIEAIVNTVKGVYPGRAVVFGVWDDKEGTELIAVIAETRTKDQKKRQAIGKAIRQAVATQSMVTVNYVAVVDPKWLIKTSSGKISRSANREKWLDSKRK